MSDTTGSSARPSSEVAYWQAHSGRIVGSVAVGILALGTVVYHFLEDWSWVDSFYFSTVAVTTVGFGDLTPSSDASKLFTVFYVFSGITVITVWLNSRFKHRAARAAVKYVPMNIDIPEAPEPRT